MDTTSLQKLTLKQLLGLQKAVEKELVSRYDTLESSGEDALTKIRVEGPILRQTLRNAVHAMNGHRTMIAAAPIPEAPAAADCTHRYRTATGACLNCGEDIPARANVK